MTRSFSLVSAGIFNVAPPPPKVIPPEAKALNVRSKRSTLCRNSHNAFCLAMSFSASCPISNDFVMRCDNMRCRPDKLMATAPTSRRYEIKKLRVRAVKSNRINNRMGKKSEA